MIEKISNKNITYLFYFIAVVILLSTVGIYKLFKQTSYVIKTTNLKSNVEYIDNIASNISTMIKNKTSDDIHNSLKKDKKLREDIEKNLQLFITKRYRYIYVVDKKSPKSKEFRFLLDGAKNIDEKSDFLESFTPLNAEVWNRVYKIKKPLFFQHNNIKSLWLTYLKPIVSNGKVQAIIAIDFSLSDHQTIISSMDRLYKISALLIIGAIILFFIIILFSIIDKKRIFELNQKTKEIEKFNATLQEKIDAEVEKNRQKDKQMLQQSRLAQMGEMISMIAHQWRQPLAAIGSTSASITIKAKLNKLDKEIAIKLSSKISEYSQHLSSTIDDFRDFFKTNKEKKSAKYTDMVESVLDIVETSLANKNISVIRDFKSDIFFDTYPNEVKQVILNLMKNAEDILLEKKIENPIIKIETEDKVLRVRDNAGGIPSDIIDKVFDPYFSTKTKKDGTGLGLYMSKTIIEEHCNGVLKCYNDKNGAVFEIILKGNN